MKTQFRKAQLRKYFKEGKISIYRAGQTRWSEEMADPHYYDVKLFLSKEKAEAYAYSLSLNLGYNGFVEIWQTSYDNFNEKIEFGQYVSLEDIIDIDGDLRNTDYLGENKGHILNDDGIIVFYRHHMYMDYAYKIESVEFVKHTPLKYQSDLIQDRDSTSATYCAYFKDIDELVKEWEDSYITPFDKINSGSVYVKEFLGLERVEGYFEEEEIE